MHANVDGCEDPKIFASNSFVCDKTPNNETCDDFECDSGFQQVGGGAPKCMDKKWIVKPTCDRPPARALSCCVLSSP